MTKQLPDSLDKVLKLWDWVWLAEMEVNFDYFLEETKGKEVPSSVLHTFFRLLT